MHILRLNKNQKLYFNIPFCFSFRKPFLLFVKKRGCSSEKTEKNVVLGLFLDDFERNGDVEFLVRR